MHILIADDDPVAQEINRHWLEHSGHTVCTAADGVAALSAMAGQPFDIVLLDLRMPQLDGFAVAAALKAGAPVCGTPYLVALSAGIDAAHEAQLQAVGFAAWLPKPLRITALHAVLANLAP